jgi:hypothetical protein
VGVVTSAVAGAFAGIAAGSLSGWIGWVSAGVAFVVVVALLFAYWQRSLAGLRAAIRPIHPTPRDEVDAPF